MWITLTLEQTDCQIVTYHIVPLMIIEFIRVLKISVLQFISTMVVMSAVIIN